ncbi:MAG TPA: sulfite exporter TauE/SafE family protein [Solirubrobacteraceae bacterium]|jgi:uncharacterized membrane protein YfcA|nr:sulfite exporter TauE/SafE family protein [Solirubrobacteraceae bacterium]
MGDVPYVAAGFLVGALVGLTGIGGGSLMTPVLVFLFGLSPSVAVGTDLLFAAATKSVATLIHGTARRIDWPIVLKLAAGSLPAAIAVVVSLHGTGRTRVDPLILHALGAMLFLTALGLVFRDRLFRVGTRVNAGEGFPRTQLVLTVATGILLGTAVSLTSVGAGALGTVALFALYPRRLTPVRLVATDIAHALPLTLVAGVAHAAIGDVNYRLLADLLAGSIPGILLGTWGVVRAPGVWVRWAVAALLLVSCGRALGT